jgi:CS domain
LHSAMSDKLAPSERYTVTMLDRPIYQWNQTLTSVDIYVPIPPGVKAKQLFVHIAKNNIKFGITPNPPYMDVSP